MATDGSFEEEENRGSFVDSVARVAAATNRFVPLRCRSDMFSSIDDDIIISFVSFVIRCVKITSIEQSK